MSEQVTRSSGNVFEDLGFAREEAENLKVRATLMRSLKRLIDESGMTQTMAAQAFGVTQPRVSDLMRGKIELFSIDTLVTMLAHAGQQIEVSVGPRDDRAA
jgi:predicted XRE-type DNA-binding protein